MASSGTAGRGTLLKIDDGAGNYTTIAEVVEIGGPNFSLEAVEITNRDSTAGWKEFVGGLLDGGELTLGLNFLPAHATQSHAAGILKDMVNRTVRNFRMVLSDPGSTTWTFAALVSGFNVAPEMEGKLGAEVTLRITGQPTLA